jgi:hypothetical protein
MNTNDNSEIRELKADDLDKVTGRGGVKIPRATLGPAIPSPSPTTSGGSTMPGTTSPDSGAGYGAAGGGIDYGEPHHELD